MLIESAEDSAPRALTVEGDMARIEWVRDEDGRPISGRWFVEVGGVIVWSDVVRQGDIAEKIIQQEGDGELVDMGARIISFPEACPMVIEYLALKPRAERRIAEPSSCRQFKAEGC